MDAEGGPCLADRRPECTAATGSWSAPTATGRERVATPTRFSPKWRRRQIGVKSNEKAPSRMTTCRFSFLMSPEDVLACGPAGFSSSCRWRSSHGSVIFLGGRGCGWQFCPGQRADDAVHVQAPGALERADRAPGLGAEDLIYIDGFTRPA